MEKLYTFRVDIKYNTLEKILEGTQEIVDLCEEALICFEIAEETLKEHLQGYVRYIDDSLGSKGKTYKKIVNLIRNKLLLGQTKKGDYSHSEVKDISKYAPYILKGDHIKFYKNVDEEKLKSYKECVETFNKSKKEKSKKPGIEGFLEWFRKNKLEEYKQPISIRHQVSPSTAKMTSNRYSGIRLGYDILDYFNLNPNNPPLFMKRTIEMYMTAVMNTIARYEAPEEFEEWRIKYISSIYDINAFI